MYINYIMISKPLVVPHRGFSINQPPIYLPKQGPEKNGLSYLVRRAAHGHDGQHFEADKEGYRRHRYCSCVCD